MLVTIQFNNPMTAFLQSSNAIQEPSDGSGYKNTGPGQNWTFPKSRAQASPGLGPFFKFWALRVPKNMGSDPALQVAEDRIISQLF